MSRFQMKHAVLVDRSGGRTWLDDEYRPIFDPEEWELTIITNTWEYKRYPGVRPILIPEFTNVSVIRTLKSIVATEHVDRISTCSEHFLLPVAEVRDEFGIEGPSSVYTARLRDKWLMKQTAQEGSVPVVPGVRAFEAAKWFQHENSASFVLKPCDGSGSSGVSIINDPLVLSEQLRTLDQSSDWLIEPYMAAHLLHLDAVISNDRLVFQLSRYTRPCHLAGGDVPLSSWTIDDCSLLDAASTILAKIVQAWQITHDVLHIELLETDDGLVLLELAGRPGAAGVSQVFKITRGIDLFHAKTRADLGIDPLGEKSPVAARHGGWTVIDTSISGHISIDESGVNGHLCKQLLDNTDQRLPGIAGLGVALYIFGADQSETVHQFVNTYENRIRVRPYQED